MMEWVLRRFVAVSEGDRLQVEHAGRSYAFDVLRCTPERAIAITDADVSVNFTEPAVDAEEDDEEAVLPDGRSALTRSQELRSEEAKVEAQAAKEKEREGATLGAFSGGVEGKDFKTCPNCRHRIPIAASAMHELTCARRNWYCEQCHSVVLRSEKDAHIEQQHAPIQCDWCNEVVEKRSLLQHKRDSCPGRPVQCRYCQLKMLYRQLWEHERSCGAVTERCPKCGGRFPRKDLAAHDRLCTAEAPAVPLASTPPRRGVSFSTSTPSPAPPPRRQPDQDFMTCEKCSAAFTAFDELQVHILTEHSNEADKFALFGGSGVEKQ